ncbi:chemotaxis protein CheW [Mesoterricola silvestris]|uniref:Chemotaxis protein CheW n=1 Tax=Mesoterricola silvestris TaxID=2927979 RepID=A0AA48GK59_9BACT|nr:chemotaxis protein CheW [Mesoterricola silvestris]BDU70915.1 chemotaxis protein CheW [Mesoterricola silvestris]
MATAEATARQAHEFVPSGQLVTFTLDGVEFGLDIDRVQEITPRTAITPVPGAPSFVLGVVNLRGMIIPVLDSRLRFHLPPKPPTDKTRIIILGLAGQPTGLMVDSVAEVVKLDDFTLRDTPPLVAGVRSEYLAGMVTTGDRLITLINLEKILDSAEFGHREALADTAAGASTFMSQDAAAELVEDELPYVTFTLGRESFGINLKLVEEIIEIPTITKVPDAPPYVLGVICLRDQVLPLLDFIQLLQVEPAENPTAGDMVILLSFGQAKLGIVVDGIQEIIRIKEEEILPPPQTLSERESRDLEGVVVRSDRMVSLLKVLDIITGEDQAKIAAMSTSLIKETKEEHADSFELPLVVFRLGPEAYSLRLHEVREIIMVSNITPVPRAPSFIEGVLNLRGEVMPVIDLRERFGLERQKATNLSRIVITPIGGVSTGLVVDAVDEVKSVDQRRLEEPPRVTSVGANAFIEKVARTDQGVVFLLNVQRLLTDVEGQQLQVFQGKKKG